MATRVSVVHVTAPEGSKADVAWVRSILDRGVSPTPTRIGLVSAVRILPDAHSGDTNSFLLLVEGVVQGMGFDRGGFEEAGATVAHLGDFVEGADDGHWEQPTSGAQG
jgi:hypothetical protein